MGQMPEEVKEALEVLLRSGLVNQVEAAHMLLRRLSAHEDIGVVGRGFIQESFLGVAAVRDWIGIGQGS